MRLILTIPLLWALALSAQQKQTHGVVVDSDGHPVSGVSIASENGQLALSDASGSFEAPAGIALQFTASGYVTNTVTLIAEQSARIVLTPAGPLQEVTVTAYRTPLPSNESPVSVRVLTAGELQQSASPSLDDKLRQVPGAELFRRSSSRVANPTSQGISLRGLGSTAASRTLVVADDVPQNDPFGGWIHWQEMPELTVQSVEVVRGGASDLYGSSAIGGVINVIPVRPTEDALSLLASYGGQNTREVVGLAQGTHNEWAALASAGAFFTDGFILVAPASRGPVDIPSNVAAENAFADIEHASHSTRIFLHGSGFNEERSNGTPIQNNGTRLWRYAGGLDWANARGGALGARVYGSTEHFWQTFSSVSPDQTTERFTRYASSPASELGAIAHWQQTLAEKIVFVAGADVRDVRAEDNETAYPTLRQTDISVRQRQTGVYGEGLWIPGNWTFTAGLRGDFFRNFDAVQYLPTLQPLPLLSENVVNPRLGIVRRLGPKFALTASAFRAFRAPTPNELYRNGQVGQELTLANPNLRSERATGWEAGTQIAWHSATLRGSYFWTQVNRPITALTIATTPNSIVKRRENLGQIESRGIAIDFEASPTRWLSLVGGYQFANATVTQSPLQPQLLGNWIPQVARNMGTVQANFRSSLLGMLSIQARASGQQYDDDANQYRLAGYFRLDANYARNFGGSDGHRFQVFASGEDLTDQPMQVGRTPTLTLGTPLVGRVGIRMAFPTP